MKIKSILLSVSCLMALPFIQAQAQVIPLVNGDFSANQGQSKLFFWTSTGAPSGLIPGWTPTGPGGAINYDLGGAYVGNSGVDGATDDSNYGGACHLWLDSYDPAVYNTSSYTIQPGDNLWDIAVEYDGATVAQIKKLNNITNAQKLKPGQKIKIMPAN